MTLLKSFVLLSGAVFMLATGLATVSSARMDVNVGITVPLPIYIPAPPVVAVIPNSYVYYVPDIEAEILFYGGFWYRPYQRHWFRSRSYNGPWYYMTPHRVPSALVVIPPDYRHSPPGHQRIPHGQMKKNWSRWEREKFWYQRGYDGGHQEGLGEGYERRDHDGRGFDDRGPGGGGFENRGGGHGRGR